MSEGNPLRILNKGTIFTHVGVNPYSRSATYNFNHGSSVTLMPNGKLFVAWFSGPCEWHPWQCILSAYSEDNGLRWNVAGILQDTTNISDFDPAFIRDENRVLFLYSLGRWGPKLAGEQEGFLGAYLRYSDDSEITWSDPIQISEQAAQRTNGIRLSSGELLWGSISLQNALSYYQSPVGSAGVLKSSDHGQTWVRYGNIVTPVENDEPTIVELTTGNILMYLRTKDGYIWKSISDDQGVTWSEPSQTNIVANNSSHNLYRLKDGRITLTYNPCEPKRRTPLVIRISKDDGLTWSKPLILDVINDTSRRNNPVHPSGADYAVTYPSVAEDKFGNIIVVWAKYRITDTEHQGDIRFTRLSD